MKIFFDDKEFAVENENDNIVQIAQNHGVMIPAPCFRNSRINGCCKSCLILVNGNETYACVTKPVDGMKVTYNTPELIVKRDERLKAYSKMQKLNQPESFGCCSSNETKDENSCGCHEQVNDKENCCIDKNHDIAHDYGCDCDGSMNENSGSCCNDMKDMKNMDMDCCSGNMKDMKNMDMECCKGDE